MKTKNKLLSFFLCLCLIVPVIFVFTACKNGDVDNEDIKYGDVNNDGVVSNIDYDVLEDYLQNGDNSICIANANLNGDKDVNYEDLSILNYYLNNVNSSNGKSISLPYKVDVVYGDVNFDGNICSTTDQGYLKNYIENEGVLTINQFLNADVNLDGKIDYSDIAIMNFFLNDNFTQNSEAFDVCLPFLTEIKFGDVNCDGEVDILDIIKICSYLKDNVWMTGIHQLNADVNFDGKVDYVDYRVLLDFIENARSEDSIPTNLNNQILIGDANLDGEVDNNDKDLITNYINDKDSNPLSLIALINADTNKDCTVDSNDLSFFSD